MIPQDYYYLAGIVSATILGLILIAYSPRLVAWFGAFKHSEHLINEKKNRMAILVPARDESKTIEPLLESLSKQTYDNFKVFVIVKDPSDPTIKMTKKRGFVPVVVADQGCKSDALDGAVQMILRSDRTEFDAYLILDADTMIKDDYLAEMNNAMASGRDVIVSKKIVKITSWVGNP
jgi:Glycosyltransferases, probably involved in cell wall biogenesis